MDGWDRLLRKAGNYYADNVEAGTIPVLHLYLFVMMKHVTISNLLCTTVEQNFQNLSAELSGES